MACVCGHAPEEHRDEIRECEGTYVDHGMPHDCACLMYEDDDDPDD